MAVPSAQSPLGNRRLPGPAPSGRDSPAAIEIARPRQGLGQLSRLSGRRGRGRDRGRLDPCRPGQGAEVCRPNRSHPDIGPRAAEVKLGRAAGQDDGDVFALIWTPKA